MNVTETRQIRFACSRRMGQSALSTTRRYVWQVGKSDE